MNKRNVLFIDDDVQVPPNTYELLYETASQRNAAVVSGVTYVRSYPFNPMVFKWEGYKESDFHFIDFLNYTDESGIVEVDAVGFSCALISVKILKQLPPPFFVTYRGRLLLP